MTSQALAFAETGAPLALNLPAEMTFEQWEAEGRRLSFTSHALQWFIGDWWNAGYKFDGERRQDTAKRLFPHLTYETIRNYGSVARRVPVSRRRDSLTISHFDALASLDDDTAIETLVLKVEEQGLNVKQLRAEVQAIKAANDAPIGAVAPDEPSAKPEWPAIDILAAKYVEAMDEISSQRELTKGEADFVAMIEQCLGGEYSDRRPVPDDFEIIFVDKGRPACEPHYRASRITISRWLHQSGYSRLIRERANFVKYQREQQRAAEEAHKPVASEADSFLPVAKMAADFLRISRYGRWPVSKREAGGWFVGTSVKTSEELIAMAERQGFDREAAVTEARQEGY